jgi:hypothetical protein
MGDVASLAALALAGGFAFVQLSSLTRYQMSRAEGQRLAFFSTLAAVLLVIGARLVLETFEAFAPGLYGVLRADLWALVPGAPQPWFATAVVAFALGPAAACISNHFVNVSQITTDAIEKYGRELEKLMYTALERYMLVSLTLKGGKVYVGWPAQLPPILERETQYVRILPAMSGYRTKSLSHNVINAGSFLGSVVHPDYALHGAGRWRGGDGSECAA